MAPVSQPEDPVAFSVGNVQQIHKSMTVPALLFTTEEAHYNYILTNRDT